MARLCICAALLFVAGSSICGAELGSYIADGDADVHLAVTAVDEGSGSGIPGATVTTIVDRRVKRGPDGHLYTTPVPVRADARGQATVKASFPAAADPTGTSVFVGDSKISVAAPGYRTARVRISQNNRLDFPRRTKNHTVPIRISMKRE